MTSAIDLAKHINQLLGAEAVRLGSDKTYKVQYMSTGLLPIDIPLSGGMPRGRFIQLTGAYSTLKSYIGLCSIAEVQRRGGVAALIDTEHAFDPDWAEELGVNVDKLILWPNPDDQNDHTGEEAIDVAEIMIRNRVDLIVFDSVAATLPQAEQTKRLSRENIQPARLAALMSAACRRLTAPNSVTAVLWINQLREQVGVTFGNPEKATGGRALGYYSSAILNIRTAGNITQDTKVFTGDKNATTKRRIGQTFQVVLEKSKLSTPWQSVFFDFDLRTGRIDIVKFLFAQGVEAGFIANKGRTWEFGALRETGKDKFLQRLAKNETLLMELDEAVRKHHGLPSRAGSVVAVKKKAAASSKSSSANAASKRTQAAARAASSTTGRATKKLPKSKTLKKSTR